MLSDTVINVLAGVAAGSATALALAPLDVARTRMQVQHTLRLPAELTARSPLGALRIIARREGARGLFRGYSASAVAVPAFWSCYFATYYQAQRELEAVGAFAGITDCQARAAVTQACSSIVSAAICDVLTQPLWMVRTRLQTQAMHRAAAHAAASSLGVFATATATAMTPKYRGVIGGMRTIVKEEGFTALYKGLTASLLGGAHVAVQFPLYEYLRTVRLAQRGAAMLQRMTNGVRASAPAPVAAIALHGANANLFDPEVLASIVAAEVVDGVPTGVAVDTAAMLRAGRTSRGHDGDSGGSSATVCPATTGAARGDAREAVATTAQTAGTAPTAGDVFLASVVSKFIASSATYWHETIRSRLQDQRNGVARVYTGVWDCAVKTVRREGVRGLYSGFSVNLVRALPACAITLLTFDWASRRLRAAALA